MLNIARFGNARAGLLLCAVLVALLAWTHSSCAKGAKTLANLSAAMQKEIKEIQQTPNGSTKGVFFVHVFGGYLPVPNRYALSIRGHWDKPIQLGSPANYMANRKNLGSPYADIYGTLEIGQYKKFLERQHKEKQTHKPSMGTTKTVSLYGLHVIIYSLKEKYKKKFKKRFGTVRKASRVVIHNKKTYVWLVDADPRLWRAMLKAYAQIKANRHARVEKEKHH